MSTRTRADGHPVVLVPSAAYFARLHGKLLDRLPMWVIYRPGTMEYPRHWVARMHVCLPAVRSTRFVMTHDTLEELRAMLPEGLTVMRRLAEDFPEIVEVWV